MKIEYAKRIGRLPKYIFAAIEELKEQKKREGVDLIPLGIGDPDLNAPSLIVDELIKQVKTSENQKYPTSMGEYDYREAVARWYKVRFGGTIVSCQEQDLRPYKVLDNLYDAFRQQIFGGCDSFIIKLILSKLFLVAEKIAVWQMLD